MTIAVPEAPASARLVFGPALAQAEAYARLLCGPAIERGLVGPSEAGRIWERHLVNCAVAARLLPERGTLADIGSGAGLPGLVFAMLRPSMTVTLIEPKAKRVSFLERCRAELGLRNVGVVQARAQEVAGRITVDVVSARAVAPLERLAVLCVGLLRPGGTVLALKGARSAEAELARARPVLAGLGICDGRVVRLGGADRAAAATVVTFRAAGG